MPDILKPKFIDYSFESEVKKVDKEHNHPEVVYQFSNGRKFVSTDRSENGVYKKS
jgi:hypothetical protein